MSQVLSVQGIGLSADPCLPLYVDMKFCSSPRIEPKFKLHERKPVFHTKQDCTILYDHLFSPSRDLGITWPRRYTKYVLRTVNNHGSSCYPTKPPWKLFLHLLLAWESGSHESSASSLLLELIRWKLQAELKALVFCSSLPLESAHLEGQLLSSSLCQLPQGSASQFLD